MFMLHKHAFDMEGDQRLGKEGNSRRAVRKAVKDKRLNLVKYMMSLNESIIRKPITLCNESVPLFFFFKTLWLSQRLQSVIFPSPIWIQGL